MLPSRLNRHPPTKSDDKCQEIESTLAMKHTKVIAFALLLTTVAALHAAAQANSALTLADPFSDQMVLQREMPIPVWGKAAPNAEVKVSFAEESASTKADALGVWRVELGALPASFDNRVMTVESGASKATLKDVLVGEVWLCSGQSNMAYGNFSFPKRDYAIDHNLRVRCTQRQSSSTPSTSVVDAEKGVAGWRDCSHQHMSLSKVAYYFGHSLRQELQVPVGLIQSAVLGTAIESWLPPRAAAVGALIPNSKPNGELYNGMIVPWTKTPLRGVIWYQGETNVSTFHDGLAYAPKMKALIEQWRCAWGRTPADMPFYFVQLAPFAYTMVYPEHECTPDDLPNLWLAQFKAGRETENAGVAHTQDVGAEKTVHPHNKQPTGERLARLALSRTYHIKTQNGANIVDDTGPEFKSAQLIDGSVVVEFEHARSGLISTDKKALTHFEVAGADGKFVAADAQIKGSAVVVTSGALSAPTQVRFAWKQYCVPNLANGDKIPAAPFWEKVK